MTHHHTHVPHTDYGALKTPLPKHPHPSQAEFERELYGKWTIILRNLGGALALFTTCLIALFNAWTTYWSVSHNGGWPTDMVILTVNIGPIICAWSFLSANKTIATILRAGAGDREGVVNRLRSRIAGAIAPKPPKQE